MTKQELIESDQTLQELYDELFTSLSEALAITANIINELDRNIQGECQEKWMANKLFEELQARAEWANIGQRAWKTLLEKDSK